MKTERRHELQTNELADWVAKHYQTIAPYTKSILAVAIALLVGYAAWNVIAGRAQKNEAAEWELIDGGKEELNGLIARHSIGTPLGNIARLSLADINFNEGLDALLKDRTEGVRLIKLARENYGMVADAKADPTIQQLALCGKAKASESLGDLTEARAIYERLSGPSKALVFSDYAQQRLAEIKRQSVKTFYVDLAETRALPPEAPSKRPSTDLEIPGEKPLPDSLIEKSSIFGTTPDDKKADDKTNPLDKIPAFPGPEKNDEKTPAVPPSTDTAPDKSAAPKAPDAKTPDAKTPDTSPAPKTPAPKTPKK